MTIFFEVSIILVLAALLAYIARIFKQPIILAYLLAGMIIGPIGFKLIGSNEGIDSFASIGIALLLFIVGVELNFSKLKRLGHIVLVIALLQIALTAGLAYLFLSGLYHDHLTVLYLTLALTFGSTIIVVKLLSEKKYSDYLFGKISLGILLVQDIFVIIAIVFLESLSKNLGADLAYISFLTIIKTLALFVAVWGFGHYIVSSMLKRSARYPEILFLIAIAWCFLAANLGTFLGLSVEIGAFLAGVSIASGNYSLEISAKIKPLRDFFVIIFFVILGIQTNFSAIENYWLSLALVLFVVIVHPLIILIIMGLLGFRRRTSFAVGISITQISEFSLIIALLGKKMGHINDDVVSTITLVAIITIVISSYLITHYTKIFNKLSKYLMLFQRKNPFWEERTKEARLYYDHIILAGARRTGYSILRKLNKLKKQIVVVDFDPELAEELRAKKIPVLFGDVTDHEIVDNLNIREASMFISTIPEFEDNLLVLKYIRSKNHKISIFVTAQDTTEALALYNKGADYVLLPHHISGEHLSELLENKTQSHHNDLERFRTREINKLKKYIDKHGTEH